MAVTVVRVTRLLVGSRQTCEYRRMGLSKLSGWRQAVISEIAPENPGTGRRLNWTSVAAIILTVLGLGRSVAFWFVADKAFVGRGHWAMSISPLPTVIRGFQGGADYVRLIHLTGTTVEDESFDIGTDYGLYEDIPSCEMLRMAYADAFVMPFLERNLAILADGFCDHGPLARRLGFKAAIREIVSETPGQTVSVPDLVRVQIKCE